MCYNRLNMYKRSDTKMNKKSEIIARSAITAALYVVLTLLSYPLSYNMIQFRVSELMTLLVWFDPSYIPGLLIGCALANLFGTGGMIDVVFGTLASAFAFLLMYFLRKIKNEKLSLFLSSLCPALPHLSSHWKCALQRELRRASGFGLCILRSA